MQLISLFSSFRKTSCRCGSQVICFPENWILFLILPKEIVRVKSASDVPINCEKMFVGRKSWALYLKCWCLFILPSTYVLLVCTGFLREVQHPAKHWPSYMLSKSILAPFNLNWFCYFSSTHVFATFHRNLYLETCIFYISSKPVFATFHQKLYLQHFFYFCYIPSKSSF